MRILSISGSVTEPSRTATLATFIADEIERQIGQSVERIELSTAAPVLFRALRANQLDPAGRDIINAVEQADVLVVASPVYRASYTGALKNLFDLVDYRVLAGKPVLFAATGGTPLHGLMIDHQLRPLFAFFNALSLPTSIYATEADFDGYRLVNPDVIARVRRAVAELAGVLPASVRSDRVVPSPLSAAIA